MFPLARSWETQPFLGFIILAKLPKKTRLTACGKNRTLPFVVRYRTTNMSIQAPPRHPLRQAQDRLRYLRVTGKHFIHRLLRNKKFFSHQGESVVVANQLTAICHCEERQRLRAERGKAIWARRLLRFARNDRRLSVKPSHHQKSHP